MSVKVRPFAERIESVRAGTGPIEVRGFIRGDAFVVTFLGREYELRTREVGADEGGAYTMLHEHEQRLDFGAVLRVQHEYEPGMPPGGEIELVWERFTREKWEAAARTQGIDPAKVNLIVPPRRSVSVSFDYDGNVHGRGTLG